MRLQPNHKYAMDSHVMTDPKMPEVTEALLKKVSEDMENNCLSQETKNELLDEIKERQGVWCNPRYIDSDTWNTRESHLSCFRKNLQDIGQRS